MSDKEERDSICACLRETYNTQMMSNLSLFEVEEMSTAIYAMSKKDTFNVNIRTRMPEETCRIKDHESDEEEKDKVVDLQKRADKKKKSERLDRETK